MDNLSSFRILANSLFIDRRIIWRYMDCATDSVKLTIYK
jgi:hypothetical protein